MYCKKEHENKNTGCCKKSCTQRNEQTEAKLAKAIACLTQLAGEICDCYDCASAKKCLAEIQKLQEVSPTTKQECLGLCRCPDCPKEYVEPQEKCEHPGEDLCNECAEKCESCFGVGKHHLNCTLENTKPTSIIERFDEKFSREDINEYHENIKIIYNGTKSEAIKSFFRNEILSILERLKREKMDEATGAFDEGYDSCADEVNAEIEAIKNEIL